jgi:hypothetical protein
MKMKNERKKRSRGEKRGEKRGVVVRRERNKKVNIIIIC